MKILIISLVVGVLMLGSYLAFKPTTCMAGFCWRTTCTKYYKNCGQDCFCLIKGNETQGECYQAK